jgi:uncharacterized protein YqhQ
LRSSISGTVESPPPAREADPPVHEVNPLSDKVNYGGQAVIEGVMMRSPRFFSVACRRQNGEIVVRTEPVPAVFTRYPWERWPFMRGVFGLADTMVLGMKALLWSANVAALDDRETAAQKAPGTDGNDAESGAPVSNGGRTDTISGLAVSGSVFGGMAIGLALFVLTPSLVVGWLPKISNPLWRNVLEGGLRVALFLGYIQLISRMAHVKRLFGYHGAEHKAINGFEATGTVDVDVAARQSLIHPRCGTNFVLTVLLVKMLLASAFGWPPVWARLLIRLAMLPVTAALAYEVIRLAGIYRHVKWIQVIVAPGLLTQRLTTREPDRSMVEVAVRSLQSVMDRELATSKAPVSDQRPAVSAGSSVS